MNMATKDKRHSDFFSKGRRGADSLKIAYIVFAILLALMTFVVPASLPLWFILILIVGTGPIWNIIDGFIDDGEQWGAYQEKVWNENKAHTYFNWVCLGFLSTFTLILCIIASLTQLTALSAGSAVVMGIPISLLIGPIGGIVFAITMLWLAKKSYYDIKVFDKLIEEEKNTAEINKLKQERGLVIVDFGAWLSAGIGATGFAIIACLAFASISFPPALPIVFVVIVLSSASIKLYQLYFHPKTPKADLDNRIVRSTKMLQSNTINNKPLKENKELNINQDNIMKKKPDKFTRSVR